MPSVYLQPIRVYFVPFLHAYAHAYAIVYKKGHQMEHPDLHKAPEMQTLGGIKMKVDSTAGILASYERARYELLVLCDTLENIADSLPDRVDRQLCFHTSIMLGPLIERAHRMEEEILFPVLEHQDTGLVDLSSTIERLKMEHVGDKYTAEDLSEMLMSYGTGTHTLSAEAAGYMLRGFFEALRRHIAFEYELLIPALERSNSATSKSG